MKEIEILYSVGGTVKTKTYRAKEIKMQMNGPQSKSGSIVNFWGNPDGVIAIMFQNALAFELREVQDSGENDESHSTVPGTESATNTPTKSGAAEGSRSA